MKGLLLLFFPFFCFISSHAQDAWVGTWTSESYRDMDWENSRKDADGTYQEIINADYKLVIRITKSGDQYTVRMKNIKVKDPDYANYHSPYIVTRADGNVLWLESHNYKQPFYSNGELDEYSDITSYIRLTLSNGCIHYEFYKLHSKDYDKNMRYKEEHTYDCLSWKGSNLHLFNDNW